MNKQGEKNYMNWELFSKYQRGKVSSLEKTEIERLITESAQAGQQFAENLKIWNETECFSVEDTINIDDEWHWIQHRINKRTKVYEVMSRVFRYAAVFIFGIVGTWLFLDQLSHRAPVGMHEIFVPPGEQTQITLADGTRVHLNSDTYFSYPSDFSATKRNCELKGEAFFNVVSDPEHPFEVKTKYQKVKVFGTQFDVNAYDDSKNTITTLFHGKVSILTLDERVIAQLKPNEKAILNHQTRRMVLQTADPEMDAGWKDGIFFFKSISLQELSRKLERWYGVKIIISSEKLKKEQFTGKFFHDQTVWQALDLLKLTIPIDYLPGQRTIRVYHSNKSKKLPMKSNSN